MVTGIEMIPLVSLGIQLFTTISGLIQEKRTKHSQSELTLKRVENILKDMEPILQGESSEPDAPKYLVQLKEKVKEGKKLVQKEAKQEQLKQWVDLFWDSFKIAALQVFMEIAENLEQTKELLRSDKIDCPHKIEDTQFRLVFREFEHQNTFDKFIAANNGGSETPLQGGSSGVPQASEPVAGTSQSPSSVDNPRELNRYRSHPLRKVVFGVLARDGHAKKVVNEAIKLKGVIKTELVIRDNTEYDLITVIGTEMFNEEEMKEYLKKKLPRTHVNITERKNVKDAK